VRNIYIYILFYIIHIGTYISPFSINVGYLEKKRGVLHTERNDLVEISKKLARYKFKNNFVSSSN